MGNKCAPCLGKSAHTYDHDGIQNRFKRLAEIEDHENEKENSRLMSKGLVGQMTINNSPAGQDTTSSEHFLTKQQRDSVANQHMEFLQEYEQLITKETQKESLNHYSQADMSMYSEPTIDYGHSDENQYGQIMDVYKESVVTSKNKNYIDIEEVTIGKESNYKSIADTERGAEVDHQIEQDEYVISPLDKKSEKDDDPSNNQSEIYLYEATQNNNQDSLSDNQSHRERSPVDDQAVTINQQDNSKHTYKQESRRKNISMYHVLARQRTPKSSRLLQLQIDINAPEYDPEGKLIHSDDEEDEAAEEMLEECFNSYLLEEEVMDQQVYTGSMTSSENSDKAKEEYRENTIINQPREEEEIQQDLKRHLNIDFDAQEVASQSHSQRSGGEYADHEEYSQGSDHDYQNELRGFSHNFAGSPGQSIVENTNRRSSQLRNNTGSMTSNQSIPEQQIYQDERRRRSSAASGYVNIYQYAAPDQQDDLQDIAEQYDDTFESFAHGEHVVDNGPTSQPESPNMHLQYLNGHMPMQEIEDKISLDEEDTEVEIIPKPKQRRSKQARKPKQNISIIEENRISEPDNEEIEIQ